MQSVERAAPIADETAPPAVGAAEADATGSGAGPSLDASPDAGELADVAAYRTVEPERDLFQDGVETRLAGVLYLLNLLVRLDVPAAFEAWCREGDLSTWALVESVGRVLLSGAEDDREDSLWEALARLDGRALAEPLGAGVRSRAEVVLPADWVAEIEAETWYWASRWGRLCLWNDSAVPVAAVPRDGATPTEQARALLTRLGVGSAPLRRRPFHNAPLAAFEGTLVAPVPDALRPWLRVVVPFLRYRLRLALGAETPLEDVLRAPGRLYLTSSHVDLVQPLDAVSLAARRAGLDRDPGWLPEVGRVVLFHFEGTVYPLS